MHLANRWFGMVALAAVLSLAFMSSGCKCPGGSELEGRVNQLSNRVDSLESDLAALREECRTHEHAGEGGKGLSMVKSMPDEVRKGQEFEYQLKLTNETGDPVSNVMVKENRQSGLRFMSADPEPQGSSPYHWRFERMDAGETRTITITARATKTGTLENCATSSYETPICDTVNVVDPALKVVKKGPSEVLICDDIPLRYTVTNTGSGTAEGVVLKERLPDGLVTEDGNRSFTREIGDLSAGESRTVRVSAEAERTGNFTNQATAQGEGLSAKSNTHEMAVRKPVLEISKEAPEKKFKGQNITYSITVENTGDAAAEDTVLVDELPSGVELVEASNNGRQEGGTVRWDLGTLEPDDSRTVSAEVETGSLGNMTNEVMAEAVCAEEATATAQTEVAGIPAILLEVVDVDDPIEVGDVETYRITATNQGSEAARNVQMTVTLEDQMEYIESSGPTEAELEGNTLTFDALESLPVGEQETWQLRVRAAEAGNVRLTVKMTSEQLGERPVQETEATNFYE